jgi:thiol:disulfide interchange protein
MEMVKKILGIIFAVAGLFIVVEVIPSQIWVGLLGIAMIWFGWLLFKLSKWGEKS